MPVNRPKPEAGSNRQVISIARDSILPIMPSVTDIFGVAMLLIGLVVLGGAVALWIYLQNQFFMTNESVIQEIQESLFSLRDRKSVV